MNDSGETKIKAHDEPLFVLKYNGVLMAPKVFFLAVMALGTGFGYFLYVTQYEFGFEYLFVTIGGGVGVVVLMWLPIQIILFKEVRLYRDRIVKIWKCFGPVEVRLANANLAGACLPLASMKSIFVGRPNEIMVIVKGVSYDEGLVDTKDVQEMNSLLAELSGRNLKDFEQTRMDMYPLIKEDKNGSQ